MNTRRMSVLVTCGLCLLPLTGCFALPWTRTGNQGGSTPISLLGKLASGRIGDMNQDDVQVMTDVVRDVANAPFDAVSDDLAAAIVETIDANGIDTLDDLQALEGKDPEDIVIPDSVLENEEEIREIIATLASPETQQAMQQELQNLGQQFGVL